MTSIYLHILHVIYIFLISLASLIGWEGEERFDTLTDIVGLCASTSTGLLIDKLATYQFGTFHLCCWPQHCVVKVVSGTVLLMQNDPLNQKKSWLKIFGLSICCFGHFIGLLVFCEICKIPIVKIHSWIFMSVFHHELIVEEINQFLNTIQMQID